MASVSKRTLYVGMTSDLEGRVGGHKNKIYPDSFTARYNCVTLVYYKHFQTMAEVVDAEKQLKGGSRRDKESLINAFNPDWKDLSDNITY